MRVGGIAALDFVRRRVGEIGPVSFARMNDQHAELARGAEHLPAGRDRGLQARHVVAERFAETARLEEIALHVDDHQRGAPRSTESGAGSASKVTLGISALQSP